VLLFEGALRPGYNPIYHTGSALSLRARGWIQIANFLQLGMGMFAFAVGVYQRLNSVVGALLVTIGSWPRSPDRDGGRLAKDAKYTGLVG
jgi:Protein of unknown function (DUF998)